MPGTPNCPATQLQRFYYDVLEEAILLLKHGNENGLDKLKFLNLEATDICRLITIRVKLALAQYLDETGQSQHLAYSACTNDLACVTEIATRTELLNETEALIASCVRGQEDEKVIANTQIMLAWNRRVLASDIENFEAHPEELQNRPVTRVEVTYGPSEAQKQAD